MRCLSNQSAVSTSYESSMRITPALYPGGAEGLNDICLLASYIQYSAISLLGLAAYEWRPVVRRSRTLDLARPKWLLGLWSGLMCSGHAVHVAACVQRASVVGAVCEACLGPACKADGLGCSVGIRSRPPWPWRGNKAPLTGAVNFGQQRTILCKWHAHWAGQ